MKNNPILFLIVLLLSATSLFAQENGEEEFDTVPERMPIFSGCENLGLSYDEVRTCAGKKMLEFIYFNIKYPEAAQNNGVEGTVVLSFIVNKEGTVSNVTVVRSVGHGCDEEALRVVESFPRWIPAIENGEYRDAKLNLPIHFRLETSAPRKKKRKRN